MIKHKIIPRDISWLSFNHRVLQEAGDPSVPLHERIKFLGIFSNNLDEFFRVRVATLKRMTDISARNGNSSLLPHQTLEEINLGVLAQQEQFSRTWEKILHDLNERHIFLLKDTELDASQQAYVLSYFNEKVRSHIVPLMIEGLRSFPTLNDKSIYLACKLSDASGTILPRYALVSVPSRLPRFVIIPASVPGNKCLMLLDDVIRFCLPQVFSYFGYDTFSAHIIKVTRDAEFDIDNDVSTSLLQKLQKGIKNRKKGKPVRFIFDKQIDSGLLNYLIRRLHLTNKDDIQSGGRIHNFKDFMRFPQVVFDEISQRNRPFIHPLLQQTNSISEVILQRDVMLNFPYHSFGSVVDLFREAAIAPEVESIKVTCYRLASDSSIINALINAVRNGKSVTVILELRARFDEEANIEWKETLEEAGVKVFIGLPDMKVHAKLCLIKMRIHQRTIQYGFVSTGNLNEKTSDTYADHCLLTSNRAIMADINRVFNYLENPRNTQPLKDCKKLIVSPVSMRQQMSALIDREIKNAKAKKEAGITIKLNSLSDDEMILKLDNAARAGVKLKLIIRGICCMYTQNKKFSKKVKAISIVDEYLEHARVMVFGHGGHERVYISSADWMVRNIDHRVETACPIYDKTIQQELKDILAIQLSDNVKARVLDNQLSNEYVRDNTDNKVRSQVMIYQYLLHKKYNDVEISSH